MALNELVQTPKKSKFHLVYLKVLQCVVSSKKKFFACYLFKFFSNICDPGIIMKV